MKTGIIIFVLASFIGIIGFFGVSNYIYKKEPIIIEYKEFQSSVEQVTFILLNEKVFSEINYNPTTLRLEFYSEGKLITSIDVGTIIVLDDNHLILIRPNDYHEVWDR